MEIRRKNFIHALLSKIIYLLDGTVGVLKIAVMSIDCEYAMGQVRNLFITLLKSAFGFFYLITYSYRIGKFIQIVENM